MPVEESQTARWNGRAGTAWVASRALTDDLLRPMENALVDAVTAAGARDVLDVGCGTGGTTVALARHARCVGLDLSEQMVAAARERAAEDGSTATFLCADAQTHPFTPGEFDAIVSRFGVMFFPEPPVAFANLHRAARPGAALRCVVWRGGEENPFMLVPEQAAAPVVPGLATSPPGSAGRFSFAGPAVVHRALDASWHDVDLVPLDLECRMPESALVGYFTNFGALAQVWTDLDEHTRATAVSTVRAAFDPFVHGDEVRYTAACWMITARA
ncbi:class I SAM-dependent methyltransferase [Cryptosporangium sp. NPDC051539]|uniref:class I SAM-dependent methyltransferase n=1 Tax=Cryptosporangium sp. NPDC051539 TaxID=3363962 RepID=UPI0037AD3014